MDSLAFNWEGETCWLVPPVSLVKNLSATCFVGVEEFWWFHIGLQLPFLVERKGALRLFVLDSLFVENGKDVYLHGENNSTLFGSENFSTPVFFLLLNGAV